MMGSGGRGGGRTDGVGGGRGKTRSNVWTPADASAVAPAAAAAAAAPTGRSAPTTGPSSKVWVRPGAVIAGSGGDDPATSTPKMPCSFFAQGSCRYGEGCRFLHDPDALAAVAGDGAASDAADAGDEELPEIDLNDDTQ